MMPKHWFLIAIMLVIGYVAGAKYPKLFASIPVIGGAVSG